MNISGKIESVSEQIRGVSYKPEQVSDVLQNGYIPLLRAGNITENGIDYTDLVYVQEKCVSDIQILKYGDILIAASSGSKSVVGKAAQNINPNFKCTFGAFCKVIRPSKSINPKYLGYYFRSEKYRSIISNLSAGANINNIRNEDLNQLDIHLPPLPIQQQIADTLDKADALRRKDQELLDKYDELAQAVFYEMFGDPRINKNAYEFIELKKLIVEKDKITYGIIQPGKEVQQGVPVIRVGDFENLKVRKTGIKKVAFEIEEKYSKTRLQGDEILIACVGSIGKIALVESNEIGYNIVRATARIRVDIKKISRIYLAHYLNLPIVQEYFLKETRTVSQPTLNISHIENTRILLPKFSKQLAFEKAISYLEILKSRALKSQEKSDILFSAFCQSFFN